MEKEIKNQDILQKLSIENDTIILVTKASSEIPKFDVNSTDEVLFEIDGTLYRYFIAINTLIISAITTFDYFVSTRGYAYIKKSYLEGLLSEDDAIRVMYWDMIRTENKLKTT